MIEDRLPLEDANSGDCRKGKAEVNPEIIRRDEVVMSQEELDYKIAARPYDKVTIERINSRIAKTDYIILPNSSVTLCNLTLENGFSVRGESACVDSRNFNKEIGEQLARKDAFSKMWELEGYLLAERKWLVSKLNE